MRGGDLVTSPGVGGGLGPQRSLLMCAPHPCRTLSSSPLVQVKEEPPSRPQSPQAQEASPGRLTTVVETPLSPTALIDSILRESEPAPAASASPLTDVGARPPSTLPASSPEKCLSVACLDK